MTKVTDLAQDRDDLQALMAPPRTPNVYAALEQLNDELPPEPAPVATAVATAVPTTAAPAPASVVPMPAGDTPAPGNVMPAAAGRTDREVEWSALTAEHAAAGSEHSWADIGAEPVGPEVLRWRREDDDIVPSGVSGGRGRMRLQLRRRSAA